MMAYIIYGSLTGCQKDIHTKHNRFNSFRLGEVIIFEMLVGHHMNVLKHLGCQMHCHQQIYIYLPGLYTYIYIFRTKQTRSRDLFPIHHIAVGLGLCVSCTSIDRARPVSKNMYTYICIEENRKHTAKVLSTTQHTAPSSAISSYSTSV